MTVEINSLIRERFSPLAFDPCDIEAEKIERLFEAARWSPSSMNAQPWRFLYAKRGDQIHFTKILDILLQENQEWAQHAGLLILVAANEICDSMGKVNRYAQYDCGQAVAYLTMQALSDGLYCRQMGAFDRVKAQSEFGIPNGFVPVIVIALGYLGNVEALPSALKTRATEERVRKEFREIVFQNEWPVVVAQ